MPLLQILLGLSATTIVGAINEIEGRVDTVQTLDGIKVSKLYFNLMEQILWLALIIMEM